MMTMNLIGKAVSPKSLKASDISYAILKAEVYGLWDMTLASLWDLKLSLSRNESHLA